MATLLLIESDQRRQALWICALVPMNHTVEARTVSPARGEITSLQKYDLIVGDPGPHGKEFLALISAQNAKSLIITEYECVRRWCNDLALPVYNKLQLRTPSLLALISHALLQDGQQFSSSHVLPLHFQERISGYDA